MITDEDGTGASPPPVSAGSALALGEAALLALDWGTSSLRAYVLDRNGALSAARHEPWGLMQVEAVSGQAGRAGYQVLFDRILAEWPDLPADIPVITCGMVGSAQGWEEVPYLPVPSAVSDLASQLTPIRHSNGRTVWAVPGWRQEGRLPNVMRGEETQIVGALAQWRTLRGQPAQASRHVWSDEAEVLLCLPGSHSKWARMQGDTIVHFDTFMTGEAFHAFSQHTILARTMTSGTVADAAAFERGVRTSLADDSKGVLANVFSCRTLGLAGTLSASQQADYLSGLLIGAEVAGMRPALDCDIALVGDDALCQRYATALALADLGRTVPILSAATERGLWHIAREANLISDDDLPTSRPSLAAID